MRSPPHAARRAFPPGAVCGHLQRNTQKAGALFPPEL
jgi:hypothetical protein